MAMSVWPLMLILLHTEPPSSRLECSLWPPRAKNAEVIFFGRVAAARHDSARAALFSRGLRGLAIPADSAQLAFQANEARFVVDSIWKGLDSAEVTVFSDPSSEGVRFSVGEQFLVLGNYNRSKVLITSQCDGTVPIEDLAALAKARRELGLGRSRAPRAPNPD